MVLLIEDMHWAEDDLCDLIDTLVTQVNGPLLILVTARPEMLDRRPAWGGAWDRTSAMRLEALPRTDSDRLVAELLGAEVPDQIRDLVVERAEGNPFFVEELVGTLIDRGVLTRSNGTWAFGGCRQASRSPTRSRRCSPPELTCCRIWRRRPSRPLPLSVARSGPGRCTNWSPGRAPTSGSSRSGTSSAGAPVPRFPASASTSSSMP